MSILRLLAVVTLTVAATPSFATSFVATTDALGGASMEISDTTSDMSSSLNDDKLIIAARDDAASFVASAGDIRGVRLQAALRHIRQHAPQLQASDLQLAEAILAR